MKYDPVKHHRWSIRLKGYDYSLAGAYFVTICTQNRLCLFGNIVENQMRLNDAGEIVANEWMKTAEIRNEIELDEWVVMPNHFHGIVVITNSENMTHCRGDRPVALTDKPFAQMGKPGGQTDKPFAPTDKPGDAISGDRPVAPTDNPVAITDNRVVPTGPRSRSIGAVMAGFKSAVTKRINELHTTPGAKLWQRNYREHIVRNETELDRIREYIRNNPAQWSLDSLYSSIVVGATGRSP
jgi:REP element-mobilizing transposase RayT